MNTTTKLDIFESCESRINDKQKGSTIIIPHVCNNLGKFGAGFAMAVRNKYPNVAANFELLGSTLKLGYVQYVSAAKNQHTKNEIIFANMVAQNGIIHKKNPRPLNYEALIRCMVDVRNFINKSNHENIEIHCPKFGSGLAGGDWNFISDLIYDVWHNIPVFVYVQNKRVSNA